MGIKKCAAEMANELLDAEELEEHERVSKKQNGDDSFYSEKNMERLRKGIADLVKDPERVRESWNSVYQGTSNSHKIAVLEEGVRPDGRH